MGLKKLTIDLSEGRTDGLMSYPNHNTPSSTGGFNYDNSRSIVFDDKNFRQRDMKYKQPNHPNDLNPKPLITRKLPGIEKIPGKIFDLPPFGSKTVDIDGNSVEVPSVDVPPFTTKFIDNITDGFIRGGLIKAVNRSIVDVGRIAKFLATPRGLSWVIKQRGLQKSNPRITEPIKKRGDANQRTYNWGANTLAQVAVQAFGGHVKREGLNPLNTSPGYVDWAEKIVSKENVDISEANENDNRLVYLFGNEIVPNIQTFKRSGDISDEEGPKEKKTKIGKFLQKTGQRLLGKGKYDDKLYSYTGGPGSTYGIGRTRIRKFPVANGTTFGSTTYDARPWDSNYGFIPYDTFNVESNTNLPNYNFNKNLKIGAHYFLIPFDGPKANPALKFNSLYGDLPGYDKENPLNSDPSVLNAPTEPNVANAFDQQAYFDNTPGYTLPSTTDIYDFRKIKRLQGIDIQYTNYDTKVYKGTRTFHREKRLNSGDPGKNISQNMLGVNKMGYLTDGYDVYDEDTIDLINALDIFKAEGNFLQQEVRDLIRFQIEAVDGDDPGEQYCMVFRALLDSFGDNYNANWNNFKYNGRGEEMYTYNSFKRTIDFGFKVAAQSRHEMMPLYRKLNFLVSNLAPDYGGGDRMRGPFMKLTIGSMIDRVPGFFTNIKLTWQKDYPWDIAISHLEGGMDKDGMIVMPHLLDVTCNFTPVHNFLPQKSVTKSPFLFMHHKNRVINNPLQRWYQHDVADTRYEKDQVYKSGKNKGKVIKGKEKGTFNEAAAIKAASVSQTRSTLNSLYKSNNANLGKAYPEDPGIRKITDLSVSKEGTPAATNIKDQIEQNYRSKYVESRIKLEKIPLKLIPMDTGDPELIKPLPLAEIKKAKKKWWKF